MLEQLPGYTFLRGLARRLTGRSDEQMLQPALVEIEDALVPALIVEELEDGSFTVLVPSAPTPMAGSLYILPADRVHPVDLPFAKAISVFSNGAPVPAIRAGDAAGGTSPGGVTSFWIEEGGPARSRGSAWPGPTAGTMRGIYGRAVERHGFEWSAGPAGRCRSKSTRAVHRMGRSCSTDNTNRGRGALGQFGKVTVDGMTLPMAGRGGAKVGTARHDRARPWTALGRRPAAARLATQFLDDFEGDGEVTQIPVSSLRNWNIITSVDLLTESNAPLCRLSGSCIDLVARAEAGPAASIQAELPPRRPRRRLLPARERSRPDRCGGRVRRHGEPNPGEPRRPVDLRQQQHRLRFPKIRGPARARLGQAQVPGHGRGRRHRPGLGQCARPASGALTRQPKGARQKIGGMT